MMMKIDNKALKSLNNFEKSVSHLVFMAVQQNPKIAFHIYQAEWYAKGCIYHCKNILRYYYKFAYNVGIRANSGADVIVMHTPESQMLMFEFYSLVNLARISLDSLRNILSTLFKTPYLQLPKSFKDFKSGTTDCPLYRRLIKDPCIKYLIEIRDCIVHYRSFATNDNGLILKKGIREPSTLKHLGEPFFKGSFRWHNKRKLVVNVYLPDRIFEINSHGNKKLAKFTYRKRINILSQSLAFAKLITLTFSEAINLLMEKDAPVFSYKNYKN